MADAYKTLYGPAQLPSTVATLATVGGGKSWIIKHMSFKNVTAGAVSVELFRNGTTDPYAWINFTIPADGSAEWDGTLAMAATETLAGVASAATSVTMTVDGDEVS